MSDPTKDTCRGDVGALLAERDQCREERDRWHNEFDLLASQCRELRAQIAALTKESHQVLAEYHDEVREQARLATERNSLQAQLAKARAVLEECRPLVKCRLIDQETRGHGLADDSILTRIEAALKGGDGV